jgi:EmrB/QacA subfamily drug resistance transporter
MAEVMSGPPSTSGDAPTVRTHRQILVIMSGLMLGLFLASLDQTIVSTALPTIVGDFHRSDLLSWVITAYLLASTASTPLWGKAGDLYGRKRVLQLAIVVFLVGSVLCGASQNLFELIGFRALQGVGGGGLISLVFAIIGDVIPPRERGRYQGYFGAVLGISSVIGPLAGGFAVDSLNWRYIFYINVPLGIVALLVTNRVLKLPVRKRQVKIDWWGALLLVSGVSSILLATQSGGTDYPWGSVQIIGLFTLGFVVLAGFVLRQRLAPEPILPLDLFRRQIFTVANIISFVSGVSLFGALAFLPQYLQLVHGVSATVSGLLLFPLLVGLLVMSIASGRYISRTGNYRWFPLAGTLLVSVGLILLTQIGAHTSLALVGGYLFVFGAGLGLFIQVLTLVVQNSVPMAQMGVATSSVTFFRSMGGAIGASALGAVLTARIAYEQPRFLPPSALASGGDKVTQLVQSPDTLNKLKSTNPALHEGIIQSYAHAIDQVFLVAVPISILSVIAALFIKQIQLRGSDSPPTATDPDAQPRLLTTVPDAQTDGLRQPRPRQPRDHVTGRRRAHLPPIDPAITTTVPAQLHGTAAEAKGRAFRRSLTRRTLSLLPARPWRARPWHLRSTTASPPETSDVHRRRPAPRPGRSSRRVRLEPRRGDPPSSRRCRDRR